MESRTVKEILNDLSSLLGEIADLKDGENYPKKFTLDSRQFQVPLTVHSKS